MTTTINDARAKIDELLQGNTWTPEQIADEAAAAAAAELLLTAGVHDEGNAQVVHARHGGAFAFNDAMGWLHWTGTHWTTAGAGAAVDRAIVDTLIARSTAALKSGQAERYERLIRFCIPNKARVDGARALLRSLVYVDPGEFETDPDYLNTPSGVVDLRNARLHSHQPGQRFLHCTAVEYDPEADYSAWAAWLADAVGEDMADWLQMAIGYSLTGHTQEEILFYLYGPSRSGKGTFTETLLALLGEPLGKELDFGTFTAARTGDSQNFDLAPLKAARFIAASESNAYERFNEAKIKALTGGNQIYCAFKHRTHFSYRPQFKIWLSSNHPINADPDDEAVWGRFRVIHFPKSHLGNEDKGIKGRMREPANLRGVLAWAVEGARRWYKLGGRGLDEPAASVAAKVETRRELDNVGNWIEECCRTGQGLSTPTADLYASYRAWCNDNGVPPKQQRGLTESLRRKGYQYKRTKRARCIVGLAIG